MTKGVKSIFPECEEFTTRICCCLTSYIVDRKPTKRGIRNRMKFMFETDTGGGRANNSSANGCVLPIPGDRNQTKPEPKPQNPCGKKRKKNQRKIQKGVALTIFPLFPGIVHVRRDIKIGRRKRIDFFSFHSPPPRRRASCPGRTRLLAIKCRSFTNVQGCVAKHQQPSVGRERGCQRPGYRKGNLRSVRTSSTRKILIKDIMK